MRPARHESCTAGAAAACTPITRMPGFTAFAAMHVPAAPLPRPTGTTIASSAGWSSSISSA